MLHFPNVGLIKASNPSLELQSLLIYAVNVATGRLNASEGVGTTDQRLLCGGGPCGSHEGLTSSILQPLEGATAARFFFPLLIRILIAPFFYVSVSFL